MSISLNKTNILKLIQEKKRVDKRGFDEFREIELIPRYIHESAEGSALVRIGKTQVLVGVKAEIGEPFSDRPNEGVLITNAELVPLASPDYESGPPSEDAIELARVVDRGLRESGCIKLKDLCITEGEKCWLLFVDIHVLDYDGNLIDASALGAVLALKNTMMPHYDPKTGAVDREKKKELKLLDLPITVTASVISGEIVYDTNADEEEVSEARLSVTFKNNDNICAIQKGGSKPLSIKDIMAIIDRSEKISKELRKKLIEA